MAGSSTTSSTLSGNGERRHHQARPPSSEVIWEDAQEHLDPSDSSHDLHPRLRPSERSLLIALKDHLLSLQQQERRTGCCPSRMRRPCLRPKPRSIGKILFFRVQSLPPSPRAPPPTPGSSSNRSKSVLSCGLPVTTRKRALQKKPQRGGKFLAQLCPSQDHRQRLPSEESQLNAPIRSLVRRRTMSSQRSW